jgi:hypothetical protein
MTMRTTYYIICNCGHEGRIMLSENDQPYSTHWESWKLHELNGNLPNGSNLGIEGILTNGNVICPKCDAKLSIDNLKTYP